MGQDVKKFVVRDLRVMSILFDHYQVMYTPVGSEVIGRHKSSYTDFLQAMVEKNEAYCIASE